MLCVCVCMCVCVCVCWHTHSLTSETGCLDLVHVSRSKCKVVSCSISLWFFGLFRFLLSSSCEVSVISVCLLYCMGIDKTWLRQDHTFNFLNFVFETQLQQSNSMLHE